METVAEQWEKFLKEVIPANAPEIQVIECKKAFYSGVASLFGLLNTIPEDAPNRYAGYMLEFWNAECQKFADEVEDVK